MKSINWLIFKRKVRFGDCDSAGVIHFHNLLRWTHESWEESIETYGINLNDIFPSSISEDRKILPIINCEANFFQPIKFGDLIVIKILPEKINNHLFRVNTFFFKELNKVAEGKLVHCSIDSVSRKKVELPEKLQLWIEASKIHNKVEEC